MTVHATADPRSCEPSHKVPKCDTRVREVTANSNVASVRYATEEMVYGATAETVINEKQEGGEEWWKSEFTVRLLFVVFVFSALHSFLPRTVY